jgi:hypothetical protein
MTNKAIEAVKREILDRLDNIAFHFDERDNICAELLKYNQADLLSETPKKVEFEKLKTKIDNSELAILYEIVHLKDNVDTYFKISNRNSKEINVIDLFKPYRIAANFVNTHKHGIKGRNAKSAKIDYTVFVFDRKSEKPRAEDTVIGIITILNYDGEVFPTIDLIIDLTRAWDMFLRYHTDIDTESYWEKICKVRARNEGKSVYSAPHT